MKCLPKFSKEYFEKFRTTPLELKPYSPKSKEIASKYVKSLIKYFNDPKIEVTLRGSVAFRILGRGDIDIAVYVQKNKWLVAFKKLQNLYGDPGASGENFAAFYIYKNDFEIEISLMKGIEVPVSRAFTKFMLANPKFIKKYEELKMNFCYSKREYQIQKDKFVRKIIKLV